MSEQKTALDYLWDYAKQRGPYVQKSSYTCVGQFTPLYPKPPNSTFKADKLESTYNEKPFGSARRTWTADSLRMKEVFYQLNYITIVF